ncbi:hypothetical protein T440DRAFT_502319 [Plenodomus tracheiphilus IPT5]|uniref:Radical SAM core domain-containing protein n=1 Tax=Plenodomus tracheiphilus IPT5 TaxID=1408161 RepID=A0A6A7ATM7_9PLEO|nr:hypothetical protein T440DRAFT_502319 [Plenodomus tracheiphilus IPT5]
MVIMARLPWSRRSGPAALHRALGRGEHISPCSRITRQPTRALQSQAIATNSAIQEPSVDFPGGVSPVPGSQQSRTLDRKQAIKHAKPFSDFLTDTFNRQHDYLRISVTERCNLRCLYCMPEEGVPLSPNANMLTTPEIFYLSSLFVSQGVTKIRLTGGEPTVRRDIVPLMHQIGSLRHKGLRELALTTNGISLHRKLDTMVEAGLTGINLSLDTLDPFQFQIMTRRKGFDAVMKSIDRILEMNKMGAGVKLKVNCVVMRGLNEREIIPFVELGREKDIEVRFIEYMPFGGNKWSEGKMISFQEMLDIIRVKYPDLRAVPGHKNDTSKTFEVPGFVGKVGFITSMTNDFCSSCNRLRITSDGNLKVCLHGMAEVSLRDLLRQGNNGEPIDQEAFERIRQLEMDHNKGCISDETPLGWGQREHDLLNLIGRAVKRKEEKHADLNELAKLDNRPMILIASSGLVPPPYHDTRIAGVHQILRSPPVSTAMSSVGRHTTPPTISMLSVPLAHLYSPVTQLSSVRAFSTISTPLPITIQDQEQPLTHSEGDLSTATIPDENEEIDFFDRLNVEATLGTATTNALKRVRETRQLSDPIYNDYWHFVIDNQLMNEDGNESANADATRMLAEADARRPIEISHGRWSLNKHNRLMERVRKNAARRLQRQETKRITSSRRDALRGLLTEIETTTLGPTWIEELEGKITDLENCIVAEKAKVKSGPEPEKLVARQQLAEEHFPDIQLTPSISVLLDVVARKFYVAESKFSPDEPHCSAQSMQVWQTLRQEVVQNLKAALELPSGAESIFNEERERIIALLDMTSPETEVDAAVNDEIEELEKLVQTYRQDLAVLKATISAHSQKARDVRERRQRLHAKRKELLLQLEEQEKTAQRAVRAPQMHADLDNILNEALTKASQADEVVTLDDSQHIKGDREALLSIKAARERSIVSNEEQKKTPSDSSLEARGSLSTATDAHSPSRMPSQPPQDLRSMFSPSSSVPLFAAPRAKIAEILPPPDRRPSSALRLQVPTSNTIPIDSTLTIDLSAAVHSLQTQVYEMQQRLRSSYPRIDTLPYEVWTSENKRTLQTWLKILVSRWKTRFDDVDAGATRKGEANAVDELVKALLDQMVRDHDLSNDAAERMARHWNEIMTHRGDMAGDAEGVLDWDEFDAGGFGFMASEEDAVGQMEAQQEVGTGAKSKIFGTKGMGGGLEGISRRFYSTSSRVSREFVRTTSPSMQLEKDQHKNAKPSSSSSEEPEYGTVLPHLTPTGSAHMVSVSAKSATHRTAIAVGTVHFSNPTPLSLIRSASLKKGDVLSVSRIAGIMAAKKCPELIPLCHPIALTHVGVELAVFGPGARDDSDAADGGGRQNAAQERYGGVTIEAKVECTGPTGVEMEALTAVMGAALSVMDMCKAVDKAQRIQDVRVVKKEGGRSGVWIEEGWKGIGA